MIVYETPLLTCDTFNITKTFNGSNFIRFSTHQNSSLTFQFGLIYQNNIFFTLTLRVAEMLSDIYKHKITQSG